MKPIQPLSPVTITSSTTVNIWYSPTAQPADDVSIRIILAPPRPRLVEVFTEGCTWYFSNRENDEVDFILNTDEHKLLAIFLAANGLPRPTESSSFLKLIRITKSALQTYLQELEKGSITPAPKKLSMQVEAENPAYTDKIKLEIKHYASDSAEDDIKIFYFRDKDVLKYELIMEEYDSTRAVAELLAGKTVVEPGDRQSWHYRLCYGFELDSTAPKIKPLGGLSMRIHALLLPSLREKYGDGDLYLLAKNPIALDPKDKQDYYTFGFFTTPKTALTICVGVRRNIPKDTKPIVLNLVPGTREYLLYSLTTGGAQNGQ